MKDFDTVTMRRLPTAFEREIIEYVKNHPGLLTDEIAEAYEHTLEVYKAIAFLWANDYIRLDRDTRRIYPQEV